MFDIIKNSLVVIKNNPFLTLSFVIYLIVLSFVLPRFAVAQSLYVVVLFLTAILLITAGFLSGWFGMVKEAVVNSYKTYKSEEERIEDIFSSKKAFFGSVSSFIIPVGAMLVLVAFWFYGCEIFARKFIGSIDFLLNDTAQMTQSAQLIQYLSSLEPDKLLIIYGRQLFFLITTGAFFFFTCFWSSALYWGRGGSKNPFLAFWYSITAVFRRPLGVIGLNSFIAALFLLLMAMGGAFALHPVTSFIYMILTIYAFVFVVVLTFNYYEQKLQPQKVDSGDRPDSVGEEQVSA